ncbi:hypothetical protein [Streptomyces olivaceoviridis]|uniref:hypothetical protein n=1 Tax=Streptomyces olivaceoviridis TaxID=1921 RepID=UPI0037A8B2B9
MSWSTAAGEAVSALRRRFIGLPWHDYVGSRLPADGTQVSAETPEECPGQEGNTWATLYMLGKDRAEPGWEAGVAWTLPWIENIAD